MACKKSPKLELHDDTYIHYKTMISKDLLVHLYPTQGGHLQLKGERNIFEIYISKLNFREINDLNLK